ncbi:hypothetical protein HBI12_213350 [Parastagonospora nodorum]|nr:hypothetical protein HBI12_213350 [Parastagonospora nodorum]
MYIRAETYADVILEEYETCADRALALGVVTATNEQYYCLAFNTEYEKSSSTTLTCSLLLDPQEARKRVLYEQAAARTGLSAEVVLYEQAAARTGLPAKPACNADCVNNNNNNVALTLQFSLTAYTVSYPDPKKYLGNSSQQGRIKVLFFTDLTSREFSKVDMKSLTRLCLLIDGAKLYCKRKWAYNISKFYKGKNIYIYVLRSVDEIRADVANVFDTVVSKLDKVPTRELSSYIKTELLRDNSRKFYYLVITSEDTHYKQIIKKAYIMLLERALLILFMT